MWKTAPTYGNPDSIGTDADRDAGIRRIYAPARDCDPGNGDTRPSQCRQPVAYPHAGDAAIPHTGCDCGGVAHGVGVSCRDAIPDSQRNSRPDAVRAGAVAHSTGCREGDANSDRAAANPNRHAIRDPDNTDADGKADRNAVAYPDTIGDAHRDFCPDANCRADSDSGASTNGDANSFAIDRIFEIRRYRALEGQDDPGLVSRADRH